ncbi:MAG: preprotein translocase subunit SecE [Candidatus Cloacimonetes bacterium]|nr:preprotein translocase subunit SecE [Candidatus Cloacimonadota bacterium]
MNKVMKFLREVRTELKSVSWPTRADLIEGTTAVIVMSIITAMFLFFVDIIFKLLINKVIFGY